MKQQIQKAVHTAFSQAGDMAETVTFKHQLPYPSNPPPGYEPEYEFYTVKIIRQDYTTTEMNLSGGTITLGDKKVLLPVDQLEFRPTADKDSLVIEGKQHTIKSVRIKSNALYILRI